MTKNKEFSENTADDNPFRQFDKWFKRHESLNIAIPNSVALGTSSPEGEVSVRIVLLKSYNESGFVFYTNYNSRKSSQLTFNNKAALLFYWPEFAQQVRIEGIVKKVSEEESADYFRTRPRESQISAWASVQSSVISDRKHLENQYSQYEKKFSGQPVEKPPYWGGFQLVPHWFEFWQEADFRLHDRLIYTKRGKLWIMERLAP